MTIPQTDRQKLFLESTKLHELLGIALEDLEKVRIDPAYLVDMDRWHEGLRDKQDHRVKCVVCLAGSVLAKTFYWPFNRNYVQINQDFDLERRLSILNDLSRGAVSAAVEGKYSILLDQAPGVQQPTGAEQSLDRYVTPYEEDGGVAFINEMWQLMGVLKAHDL